MADTPGTDQDTLPPDMDPELTSEAKPPPRTILGTIRQLGPGLIIAGSIVGSGELIATTKTGAQAGISLLWLIIIGCLIKVFVQIELGRHAITHGQTTLAAFNTVPGPRKLRANWLLWFWLVMMMIGLAQLGGIVGGVGQALAISFPMSGDYAKAVQMPSSRELDTYLDWDDALLSEWDLRIEQDFRPDGETALPEGESAAGFVRRRVAEVEERLAALPAATSDELRSTFAQLQSQDPSADALEATRALLREQLLAVNSPHLGQALAERDLDLSESQVRRLQRGHDRLGSRLAELDQNDTRFAIVGQIDVRAARAQLDTAREELSILQETRDRVDDASGVAVRLGGDELSTLLEEAELDVALAEANVMYREQIVNVVVEPRTWDDKYWAAFVAFITVALLYNGRYGLIQSIATALVVGFTFITVGNVIQLQRAPEFQVSAGDILRGLSFGLPDSAGGLTTALATFGIIGVGASELITYPYWCIEKGYAKFTGRRSDSPEWATRARGWMRVMMCDALLSMVVYTVATLAFFLMGVAVLYNEGRDPDGMRMVSTLATAYVPVFGEHAKWLFLIGAVAVLYSTFLVANAGHSRMFTDALKVWGLMDPHDQQKHNRSISFFGVALPLICLALFWTGINPVTAVLVAGMMQATMLPMIGFAALYFRRTATDPRLSPSKTWDIMLLVSCLGLLIAGVWGVISRLT